MKKPWSIYQEGRAALGNFNKKIKFPNIARDESVTLENYWDKSLLLKWHNKSLLKKNGIGR